jgi:hypothetical protein
LIAARTSSRRYAGAPAIRACAPQGDAAALRFPDAPFDRVFSLLVLHFVSDAQRAVDEIMRVLKLTIVKRY